MTTTKRSPQYVRALAAGLAVSAVALVGCTSDDEFDSKEPTVDSTVDAATTTSSTADDSSDPTDTGDTDAGQEQGTVDPHAAIETALAESPGAAVVEIERDTSDGVDVWEMNLLTADGSGLEIKVAVDDGRIVKQGSTTLDAEQRTAPTITAAEIITIALDAQPGELREAEVDTEHGTVVWQVKIRTAEGAEVKTYFSPDTGEVVRP